MLRPEAQSPNQDYQQGGISSRTSAFFKATYHHEYMEAVLSIYVVGDRDLKSKRALTSSDRCIPKTRIASQGPPSLKALDLGGTDANMTDSANNQSRPPRRAGPARARALAQKDASHRDSDANSSVTGWLKGAHEAIALHPQWLQVPCVTDHSGDFSMMLPRTDFIPGECLCFCLLRLVVTVGLLLYHRQFGCVLPSYPFWSCYEPREDALLRRRLSGLLLGH